MHRSLIIFLLVTGWASVAWAQDKPQPQAAQPQVAGDDATATQTPDREPGNAADLPPADRLATLRKQLERWVTQTGVPTEGERQAVAQRLDALAEQSAKLADELPEAQQKLQARYLELTVRNAQLQQAQASGDAREQSYRVGQLRTAAFKAKSVDTGSADAMGDFWLLQADLYDLNRATDDVSERQRRAIELMERFVRPPSAASAANRRQAELRRNAAPARSTDDDQVRSPVNSAAQGATAVAPTAQRGAVTQQEDAASASAGEAAAVDDARARQTITRDVKLALLRLYDQQGRSVDAARLVSELRREAADDDALQAHLDQWFGYTPVIGQRFDANLNLSDGDANGKPIVWSSREHRGKVVLLCFWADWYAPSVEAVDKLGPAVARFADQGFNVLLVQLPATPPAAAASGQEGAEESQTTPPAVKPAGTHAPTPQVLAQSDVRKREYGDRAGAKPAWPNYREGPGQVSLRRMFAVRSLPRYALIARDGRVAAVGGSEAILDQVPALLAEPATNAYRGR